MIYGTWNAASVTTGTIDFRGTTAGSAVKIPHRLLGAGVTNMVASAAATAWHATETGTIVIGVCASDDTGTWFAVLA